MKSETILLCEGYYDRAFWDGWLRHLGCVEERSDPWKKPVRGGQYGYRTPRDGFLRLTPCLGKDKILPWARQRLAGRRVEPVTALVVCVDGLSQNGSPDAPTLLSRTPKTMPGRIWPVGMPITAVRLS